MTRDIYTFNKVAILATGDEITNGDILNTNSQVIAQKLFFNGIKMGVHIAVPDNKNDIESTIQYLLMSHSALIITGGLGPTSDDITRYALALALKRELVFNNEVWASICEKFKQLGIKGEPPQGNRQQALFPEAATIIPNINGTAAGCLIKLRDHIIFMLPGPPNECVPMVNDIVLPKLKERGLQEIQYFKSWLLFGVSEGQIAEELDAIAKPFECTTGYRLFYPYIEFKIFSTNERSFRSLVEAVEKRVAPHLLGDGKKPVSENLREKLTKLNFVLTIRDSATGGLLEHTLKTPETTAHIDFATNVDPVVIIKGLKEFWLGDKNSKTELEITFVNGKRINQKIPFRGSRVKQYAVEFICHQINEFVNGMLKTDELESNITTNDTN